MLRQGSFRTPAHACVRRVPRVLIVGAFGHGSHPEQRSERAACDVAGPGTVKTLMRGRLIPLALLALVLPGCAVETQSSRGGEGSATAVTTVARAEVTTKIVGTTPRQEAVLREILGGLGETVIEEIRVTQAGDGWTSFRPHSVVVHLKTAKTDERDRAGWEATLVAEAFEARSRELQLQPVAAYETASEGVALDGPEEPEPDDREPVARKEIGSAIVSGAKASGAEIVTLRIGQPRHVAAAVTLRVDDPASFLKHRLHTFLEAVPSPLTRRYDGLYVLVNDRKGKYVWLSAETVGESISSGTAGARPDLEACYPTERIGGPGDKPPPPCPVD
jgi:hypothetical protein